MSAAPIAMLPAMPMSAPPVRPAAALRVVVIGAGMAGLVTAHELLRRGHEPIVLEARHRVGGRVYTVRDFAPGLYAEFGAMRIPAVHRLTLDYCRELGLRLRPFVTSNPAALVHVGGRRLTAAQVEADPAVLPWPVTATEHGRGPDRMWQDATAEVREAYRRGGMAGLEAAAAGYDGYSIWQFLTARGWSEAAIEQYAVMTFTEPTLGTSIVQEFREIVGRAYEDMYEIVGGMDRLPMALYQRLRHNIRFGAPVVAVTQRDDGVDVVAEVAGSRVTVAADYAVCTVPAPVLRGVDFTPALSAGKQRALRQVHYDTATKIFFQMRRPFWEDDDGIRGGTTVTDLPIRRIVYPSQTAGPDERAMLLASYTWGQDALRWAALPAGERFARALREVARVHPGAQAGFEAAVSHSWHDDPWAMGAYALFEPGQSTRLQPDLSRAEGRIHFAGEHCSPWPAWIEGAVESGLRAARDVQLAASAGLPVRPPAGRSWT